jgi:alkanesulfonate monooxygenase SsuD/methylene tetrahydromethanopterin reductase-like flavin-dependent oxidoreductase (luciferase family)
MHFGVFIEELRPGVGEADAFRESFETVDAAEALGFDCVWLGEIHFNPARSVLSSPIAMATAIAARTRRIHVGTAVQVLPLNHPLRIAEDTATVDHLSEGRFEFGIGRSGAPRAYDVLGIPYGESQARFREALEIIKEAWKGQPFSYQGKFYRFENATVAPRPYQKPHPPIRMAANTPDTFSLVGELGLALFAGLRDLDIPELVECLQLYRRAWRKAGHAGQPSVYLRIPVYAGLTETGALEEPRESITAFFRRQADLMRTSVGRAGAGPADRRAAKAERLGQLPYEEVLRTRVAFGTAAQLIHRLTGLREQLGLDGVVVEPNPAGLIPTEYAARSLRIVARDVMPAFK